MDYPIHIDTFSMELTILYFKGLPVKISIKWWTSVLEDWFVLGKQYRPWWNVPLWGISSGSSLFAKVPVYLCIKNEKGCIYVVRNSGTFNFLSVWLKMQIFFNIQ